MKLRSRRNLGFGKIPKVPFVASVSKEIVCKCFAHDGPYILCVATVQKNMFVRPLCGTTSAYKWFLLDVKSSLCLFGKHIFRNIW